MGDDGSVLRLCTKKGHLRSADEEGKGFDRSEGTMTAPVRILVRRFKGLTVVDRGGEFSWRIGL